MRGRAGLSLHESQGLRAVMETGGYPPKVAKLFSGQVLALPVALACQGGTPSPRGPSPSSPVAPLRRA